MITGRLSRIHQISMRAHDVERAVRFYSDALGLPFLFAAPPRLAFFYCEGVRLMLSTPEPTPNAGESQAGAVFATGSPMRSLAHVRGNP